MSKAAHECACWWELLVTETAGFSLFSLVDVEYLGSTVHVIARLASPGKSVREDVATVSPRTEGFAEMDPA